MAVCSVSGLQLPVLQTVPGHLETVDVSGGVAALLRLQLGQARVQCGEDPAQHAQHQEH